MLVHQASKMFGDSRPRRTYHFGEVLVAERERQKSTSRIEDSELRRQFLKRKEDTLAQVELAEEAIAMQEIVLVKLP